MFKIPSQTVCLALLVKPNKSISETALLSVKPLIDYWIICSQGMHDHEQQHVKNILAGIEGHFVKSACSHYGESKNILVREAQKHAAWALLLEANEEICLLESSLTLPSSGDIGIIGVTRDKCVTSEARLFKSAYAASFIYPAAEQVDLGTTEVNDVKSFSISSQAFQSDWVGDKVANRFLLDAVLGKFPLNAELLLSLGRIELAHGQLDLALGHFIGISELTSTNKISWMAHYLAGGIYVAKRELVQAIHHWQTAFELAPNRAEPLLRLAELHINEQDFVPAALLAEQASDIDKPNHVDYYEPAVYTHSAHILTAQAWHQLGRSDDAIELLNALSEQSHTKAIKNEVRCALNEIESAADIASASDHQQKASTDTVDASTAAQPKLTIGMATHDDFDGVYFSVMSLMLYHQACLADIEILIIDNNPRSKHGTAVDSLAKRVPNMRYVAAEEYNGTAIRERVFQEAVGKYVVCMDCHVFLHAGAVQRLIDYFDANPNSTDILHGPIYYDNHEDYSTHMSSEWREGFYGRWARNEQGGDIENEPFEIPMQGLGLFACVKDAWPGFNLKFRGFGGEEGYIHEKFRQHGGRVLCLPFLRWTHRFDRPNAPTYDNSWEDRIRNYLIGWDELGLEIKPILEHFSDMLGKANTGRIYSRFLVEKMNPWWSFDTLYFFSSAQFTPPLFTGFGVQRTIRATHSRKDLTSLLKQAIERDLPNILLLVAKTSDKVELESAVTNSVTMFNQMNTNIKGIQLIDHTLFQAALLDRDFIPLVMQLPENGDDIDSIPDLSQLQNTLSIAV